MHRILNWVTSVLVVFGAFNVAAQQPTPVASPPTSVARVTPTIRSTPPRLLPGTRLNVFGTIQGSARTSGNGLIPDATLRLRDARIGRIVDAQMSDKSGLFTFRGVDPGSYVVELLGSDNLSILAASPILNVGAGDTISAAIKLPFHVPIPALAGVLGNSTPSAAAVSTQAAASGVLGVIVAGEPVTNRPPPVQ